MKQAKQLLLALAASMISFTAMAGAGTASDPFLVCRGSQFKLTSNTYPSSATFNWTKVDGAIAGTEGEILAGANKQGTYLISTTGSDAAGDTLKYTLQVGSSDGCSSTIQTFYVVVVDPAVNLALAAGTDDAYCQEVITEAGQVIDLQATSANAGYTIPNVSYTWTASPSPATVVDVNAATTTGSVFATPGTYTFEVNTSVPVDVAPAGGCVASATVDVVVMPTPVAPTVTISAE